MAFEELEKGNMTNFSTTANSSSEICPKYEFEHIFNWIIICVGIPTIFLVSYALVRLVKADHVAPVFVINLLLSNLLQIITRPVFTVMENGIPINNNVYNFFAQLVNIGFVSGPFFIVCISLERYLVVAHPVWYRYRRNIRNSVLVAAAGWLFATPFAIVVFYKFSKYIHEIFAIVFLLPFPFLVFFNVGTIKHLSGTINLPRAEKRRIFSTLLMVLGIYLVLFLPYSFFHLFKELFNKSDSCYLEQIVFNLVDLSAIVDPVLYIFMRKDVRWIFKLSICCRGLMGVNDSSRTSEGYQEESGALGSTQVEAVSSV
ncbi:CX3C chemokine receptor 1-like [Arapaima gigas]